MSANNALTSYLSTFNEFKSTPRIQSLYSDLGRQKISNPSGYAANLSWWRTTLQEIVSRRIQPKDVDALILHVDQDLSDSLRWEKVGRPAGLGTLVADLVHDGVLHPVDQFLASSVSIYESGSVVGRVADILIKRSLWWALEHLNLVNSEVDESASAKWKRVCGDYVVTAPLERLANVIIAAQDEKSQLIISESLYSVDSFKRHVETCASGLTGGHKGFSDKDIKVLIKYLLRDRKVLVVEGEAIKFIEDPNAKAITSIDRGVLELKTTVERVEQQVEHIQSTISSRTEQIKAALAASRKEVARIQLASRKSLESLLLQRLNTLATLTAALTSIDQAHGDAAILRAYDTSSKVLKEIMSKPEMQKERVDEIMDQLRAGIEDAEEVRKAVEEGGWEVIEATGNNVDEDELQGELDEIIKQEKEAAAHPATGRTPMPVATPVSAASAEFDEKRVAEVADRLAAQTLSEKTSPLRSSEKVAEMA